MYEIVTLHQYCGLLLLPSGYWYCCLDLGATGRTNQLIAEKIFQHLKILSLLPNLLKIRIKQWGFCSRCCYQRPIENAENVQWSNWQRSSSTQFNCVPTTINILSTPWPPVSVWFGPPTNLGPMWYQLELETAGSKASCNVIAAFLTRFVHFWPQMALILDTHDENVFLLFRFIAVFSLHFIFWFSFQE